jgi:magnesium-transporting ATPase (P-type)
MAAITGESLPQVRNAEPETAGEVQDSCNLLLAGTSLVAGDGRALVYAFGAATQFGRIAHLAQSSHTAPSPLRRELARLSRLIALLAVAIGILFFVAAAWIGVPPWRDLIFAIGIIVALVPESLLPTLTLALVLAAQRMARRQVLIRNLTAVETLGSATVICTDKTRTLTENRMAVREIHLGARPRRVDGSADGGELARRYPESSPASGTVTSSDRLRPMATRGRPAIRSRLRCRTCTERSPPRRRRPDGSTRCRSTAGACGKPLWSRHRPGPGSTARAPARRFWCRAALSRAPTPCARWTRRSAPGSSTRRRR